MAESDRRRWCSTRSTPASAAAAAVAVGAALAELGADTQVLVVTHLAQVAAPATTQLLVSKDVSRHVTVTSVAQVDGEERVVEIARMLAGDDSAAAREHARELLESLARSVHPFRATRGMVISRRAVRRNRAESP